MEVVSKLFIILILILINAIFAGSEAAIVASNEYKIKNDIEKGYKKAKIVLEYKENPTNFLSAIQVGITFLGFINGFLAAESFTDPLLKLLPQNIQMVNFVPILIKIVITILLTYVQVIFGEIIPKRIAMNNPEQFIYRFIPFVNVFKKITRPLVFLLTVSSNFFSKLFKIALEKEELTEDELKLLVRSSGKALKDEEKEMFEKILEFDDQIISDVMTHRTEVAAIEINDTYDDIINIIKEEQYSRYPVYEETIDNIIGILYAKDLITNDFSRENNDFKRLLKKPYFVPEVMTTNTLFNEMRKNKNHMAIVIDEFGGTSGVVTMENIIEEIVGNIYDEHDELKEDVKEISEGVYIVDGLVSIDYVEDIIHAKLPIDDYDTLSGFILGFIGRLPNKNEAISFIFNNYLYEVLSYDDKIIKTIKVSKVLEMSGEDNDN